MRGCVQSLGLCAVLAATLGGCSSPSFANDTVGGSWLEITFSHPPTGPGYYTVTLSPAGGGSVATCMIFLPAYAQTGLCNRDESDDSFLAELTMSKDTNAIEGMYVDLPTGKFKRPYLTVSTPDRPVFAGEISPTYESFKGLCDTGLDTCVHGTVTVDF